MAHPTQQAFCESVRNMFPDHFTSGKALDVGSYNVNGINKPLFTGASEYVGLDAAPGPNVDLISLAHELAHPDGSYRVVITTSMLEHDMFWRESLKNMVRLVCPGGLLVITCAGAGYPEHGTRQTNLWASPANLHTPGWQDYYRNLEEEDLRSVVDFDSAFSTYAFTYLPATWDQFFWGIRSSTSGRQ